MTVEMFYLLNHGDYEDIFSRIHSDALIIKFLKRFSADTSFQGLMDAVNNKDISASFLAAHRLKGLAANLSFTELFNVLNELTEQLRPQTAQADETLVRRVIDSYYAIIRDIECIEN